MIACIVPSEAKEQFGNSVFTTKYIKDKTQDISYLTWYKIIYDLQLCSKHLLIYDDVSYITVLYSTERVNSGEGVSKTLASFWI